ncbi:MAG: LacI family DNA-binding transcriptional regulator [Phenylobacterium sp.]|uniref:LacI family DNA-binding transcriptional regulator n=1 Tax=Phenylobacterium sp. TaxID=1871053 RepID=UPI0027339474|nr:LacI family DNA-binding transcriptional regulator [Phenylobacterium sp.]MDP3745751.1 LacI family DNA-binding transcriptional regulator [Phenylobacterium sp.]
MGAVTIYDVAERAGVSIKSVSRVLNGEQNVSVALRAKVQEAVDALGYRPSLSARSLAGSSSYLIAAFVDADLTIEHWRSGRGNDYLSRMELGALIEARNSGYHLMIELVDPGSPTLERDMSSVLGSLKPDGVILTPPISDASVVLDVLEARGTPYVRLGPETQLDRGRRVYMDERRAAFDMTVHLARLGHREIGFIVGNPRYAASRLRREGFEAAMAQHGLAVRDDWVLEGDFTFTSGFECGARMLAGAERPTAIFASNDDMAFGVLQAASRGGLAVPADLSLVGFDDTPSAQFSMPQLTTVRQPVAEMAETAARMLISAAQAKTDDGLERVHQAAYTLIARESSAPPRLARAARIPVGQG